MAAPDGTLRYRRLLTADWLRVRLGLGMTVSEMAADAGCSHRAIYGAMRRHGIAGPGQYRGPALRWAHVLTRGYLTESYVEAGMTCVEIAAEVGCAASTVGRALDRLGIPARPPAVGGTRIYEVAQQADETDRQAAARVGADLTTATRQRWAAGVQRPRGRQAMDDTLLAEVERRRLAGERLQDLAVEHGVPYRVLWGRLDRWRRRTGGA